MFTKKITYTDYDGEERTETFYFNISRAELTELQLTYPGGYAEHIEKVTESKDRAELVKMFKDIIHRSYGEKSEDGRRLIKSDTLSDAFMQMPAYDELFMQLATDADFAASFIAGVVPDFGNPDQKAEILEKARQRIEEKHQEALKADQRSLE